MTIAELLSITLPRLEGKPACSIFESVRRVQSIIVNRLLLKRSNLVKDSLIIGVTMGDDYITLTPSGGRTFLAVAGEPCIIVDGARKYLTPYDSALTVSATAGRPKYYERVGRKLYLYPVSDAAYDITMPAFVSPVAATDLDGELPFNGILDDAFSEAVYGVMLLGTAAVNDPAFTNVINTQVDQALLAIDIAEEQALADSINYR
jgi:hypothetical protein